MIFSKKVRLNGLKNSYPEWVQWLILKNRLTYDSERGAWLLYEQTELRDKDYLVRESDRIRVIKNES